MSTQRRKTAIPDQEGIDGLMIAQSDEGPALGIAHPRQAVEASLAVDSR
jgi:hypothetical protein